MEPPARVRGVKPKRPARERMGELGADGGAEGGRGDEDHVESQCGDVDGVPADGFGDGTREVGAAAETDQEETGCEGLGHFADVEVGGGLW